MNAYHLVLIAAMVLQLVAWRCFPSWLTPQETDQEVINILVVLVQIAS